MKAKVNLFLKAGATEVWLVNEKGEFHYFDANGEQQCSRFNVKIEKLV